MLGGGQTLSWPTSLCGHSSHHCQRTWGLGLCGLTRGWGSSGQAGERLAQSLQPCQGAAWIHPGGGPGHHQGSAGWGAHGTVVWETSDGVDHWAGFRGGLSSGFW